METGGKNNKVLDPGLNLFSPSNSYYLSEQRGVEIIYESEESEDGIQCYLQELGIPETSHNLTSVAADLHPYNLMSGETHSYQGVTTNGNESTNVQIPQVVVEKDLGPKVDKLKGECSRSLDASSLDKSNSLVSKEPPQISISKSILLTLLSKTV